MYSSYPRAKTLRLILSRVGLAGKCRPTTLGNAVPPLWELHPTAAHISRAHGHPSGQPQHEQHPQHPTPDFGRVLYSSHLLLIPLSIGCHLHHLYPLADKVQDQRPQHPLMDEGRIRAKPWAHPVPQKPQGWGLSTSPPRLRVWSPAYGPVTGAERAARKQNQPHLITPTSPR